jgi:hypothetical protein
MTDFDGSAMENTLKGLANNTDTYKEMECSLRDLESGVSDGDTGLYCPHSYDTLLCWPRTPADTLAFLPCFEELNGIKYDTNREYSSTSCLFIFKIYFYIQL